MLKKNSLILLIVVCCWFLACDSESPPNKRARKAADAKGDILIGCVGTSTSPSFFREGIMMAAEEINTKGGLLGRQIRIEYHDDEGDPKKAQRVAQTLAKNQDVIAVIGHRLSNIAIPVSITYEKNGILFLSIGSTNPSLTRYNKNYIFRNIPTDEETGRQLVEYSLGQGYKRLAVFYQRDFEGKRLAEIFHELATEKGIDIVSRKSFFESQQDFKSELWLVKKNYSFDAIFIAGLLPASAYLIKQAREMGITVPIIGGSGLDSPMLITEAARAAEGVVATTVFNPNCSERKCRSFVNRFEEVYGFAPDTWAAQGYDALSVIAEIIEASGSTVPIILSSNLKFLENWEGINGSYSFDRQGDIIGKKIYFKEVKNRKFVFLETDQEAQVDAYNFNESTTLRLPLEVPVTSIDPGLNVETASTEIIEQLFLGLTDLNPSTYAAAPELARSWSASENSTVYRFNLRDDAFWTNGDPVTAHDVVWALQRNIQPETEAPNASMLYVVKNAQAIHSGEIKNVSALGVKALDDFTLEFELAHPAVYFPTLVGMPIYRPLPRKAIEKYKTNWTDSDKIVTNGSYRLALWDRGMVLVLKKNAGYYNAESVRIPEVRYFNIHNSSLGLAMYINDELDIMGSSYLRLPAMEISSILQNPELRREYRKEPIFCTYAYAFNIEQPPVDNVLVRKAISAAIDRQLLIDVITGGGEEVATTYTRPPVFGSVNPDENIGIRFNPKQARQWLAEAGYPDCDGFPSGKIVLLYNESETHKKIAEAIRSSLRHNLGIDIKLDEVSFNRYIKTITGPEAPQMFRLGWCSDYPDINNWLNDQFHPRHPVIRTGLENSEFEKLLDDSQMETDLEKRKTLFQRAEKILCEEEAAVLPLFYETAHCLVKSRLKGWHHMALGGQHIRDWYFEEK